MAGLEVDEGRDLTSAAAGELGATGGGDGAEVRLGDVERWISQVCVVEDVGEGAFDTEVHPLGDGDRLAESCGEVEGPWADGHTDAVPLESAKRAAAWCEYLEPHARRIYAVALRPP